MTTYTDIVDSIGFYLNQVGAVFYAQDGIYPTITPAPPAYVKRIPVSAPNEAVAMLVYNSEGSLNPGMRVAQWHLQTRVRAPYDADILADRIKRVLVGVHNTRWNGVRVQTIKHLSTAQLGVDAADLDERTDNYLVITLEDPE